MAGTLPIFTHWILASYLYLITMQGDKTPTILVRIPMANTLRYRAATSVFARFWAQRGYTVVVQGTRGRYKSTGQYYPLMSERRDGMETLDHMALSFSIAM